MKNIKNVAMLLLAALPVFAGSAKISHDMANGNGGTVNVIVQFRHKPGQSHFQKVIQKGGRLKADLGIVKGGLFTIPANALEELAKDPEIVYISPDRPVKGMLDLASPAVNANIALQYGYDGTGIGIAVIDSGIASDQD